MLVVVLRVGAPVVRKSKSDRIATEFVARANLALKRLERRDSQSRSVRATVRNVSSSSLAQFRSHLDVCTIVRQESDPQHSTWVKCYATALLTHYLFQRVEAATYAGARLAHKRLPAR